MDLSLPGHEDPILEAMRLSPEERDAYFNCLLAWRSRMPPVFHRLGGHPEALQDDPKNYPYAASLGLPGNSDTFARAEESDRHQGAAEWELLLQLGSDESAGMMWGDDGAIYFLIRKDDLAERRFDHIWLVLRCH